MLHETLLKQTIKVGFPYLLTALHALATWLGCEVIVRRKKCSLRVPEGQLIDRVKIALYSILYSFNVTLSNSSL
jgi:hypothetical protein